MAVAVDADHDPGRRGPPREFAVHVEVDRRSVDFEDGAGADRGFEQRVEVQIVTDAVPDDPVPSDAR